MKEPQSEIERSLLDSYISPPEKRKAPLKAKKNGGKCGEECQYNHGDKCMFGKRNEWGCWIETEGIERKLAEISTLRMREDMLKASGKIPYDGGVVAGMAAKVFNFVYRGHEYVMGESARDQGKCPHCDHLAPDGRFWRSEDDAFIGEFFYHTTISYKEQ